MYEIIYNNIHDWIILKLLFLTAISVLVHKLIKNRKNNYFRSFLLLFSCIVISIFICWIPYLYIREPDGDESEWILYARNLFHSPKFYFEHYNPIQFSRFLTILPLSLFCIFTNSLKWLHARILCNILWALYIFINFKIFQKYFNNNKAIISCLLLTIIISLTSENMIISYNSELPAIIILSVIIYLFSCYFLNDLKSKFYLIIIGLLIPFSNIAKEQTLLISIALELLLIFYLIHLKNFEGLFILFITNLISLTTIILPIILLDKQGDFWEHLELRRNLSYEGWFNEDFNIYRHFYKILIHFSKSLICFIYVISLIGFLSIIQKKKINILINQKKIFMLTLLFLLGNFACFLTYYNTSSFFDHQLLFLFPFVTILIPLFIKFLFSIRAKYKFLLFPLLYFTSVLYLLNHNKYASNNILKQLSYDSKSNFIKSKKLSNSIALNFRINDRLIVWGWDNSYYVENELLSGSRYPNIAVLYHKISNEKIRANVINKYIFDIKTLKPRFIIEAVGKNEFFTKSQDEFGIYAYHNIYKIILSDYYLFDMDKYRKLYIRKNNKNY